MDVIRYLIENSFAPDEKSAFYILEAMSDEWLDIILEANKVDEYRAKRFKQSEKELPGYSSTKDIARSKSNRRNYAFLDRDTHPEVEPRPRRTYRGQIDTSNLRPQRQYAHRGERNIRKPRPGTSPEERRWAQLSPEQGKYEKMQRRKREGVAPTPPDEPSIESRKQALLKRGERRRSLRTQAINSIRRAIGSGFAS